MKPAELENWETIEGNVRLIEVGLFSDGAYYFVYEDGAVFRITKAELRIEDSVVLKPLNSCAKTFSS